MKTAGRTLTAKIAALLLCAVLITAEEATNAYAAPIVLTGKDGWYFTNVDSAEADYQGANLYTSEQLDLILQNFLNMRDNFEENGIEFIVYLAPNKEHVYDEYMPDSSGALAPLTRIEQLYYLLGSNGIRVIYPEEMLREAKEEYPYDMYYKTDSHWNEAGTYLCAKLLMEELGYDMPELEDLSVIPYAVDDKDCAQLLGKKLPDVGYTITGYEEEEPGEDRVFICGDSFGLQLSDCIRPLVNDSIIVHRDIYEASMPYEWGATVVVYQILERFLDTIPEFFTRAF